MPITSNITRNDIDKLWYGQVEDSKVQFKLIEKFKTENLINSLIIDVGGGVGGALSHFDESNDRVLLDYSEQHLNYATSMNIRAIKGGLESFEQKADVVILSHVIEHWNDFQEQIKSLVKIQKIRKTLNYIEFPGVDSLKEGRRGGDLLGDIHIPHFYYFSMCVFENLMNRNGFEKIYMDSEIRAVFIYTGIRSDVVNHYETVVKDLRKAEITRRRIILRNLLLPESIKPFLRLSRDYLYKKYQKKGSF